jgi:hypothetical protein
MTIINVPSDYLTINEAIIASNSGDTIIVAAGTYTERIFINKSNLTLLGAQSNVDARTRDVISESIITFETDIINLSMPNTILNGFTIQGIGTPLKSTTGIFGADIGTYPPTTSKIDLTGLQIINNTIKDNTNGVLLASIEPFAKNPNYLIQHNYFLNNTTNGIYFNNNSFFTINQNIFDGPGSINISNGSNTNINGNILNQGGSIILNNINNLLIDDNVMFETVNGIFIGSGSTNTTISNNLIYNVKDNGIRIHEGNSFVTINSNNIIDSVNVGVKISQDTSPNTNITINNNNIVSTSTRILLDANSYKGTIDVTNNYYGADPTKENIIINNNIPITIVPFLSSEIQTDDPFSITKTTTSVNVPFGTPISFDISLIINKDGPSYKLYSFTDNLPALDSGNAWSITTQNHTGFFAITGSVGSQQLIVTETLPRVVDPGTYTVTVSANTNGADAGDTRNNTSTAQIKFNGSSGLIQTKSSSATASIALCIHGSSMIQMKDGQKRIDQIQQGDQVLSGEKEYAKVKEVVQCWLSFLGVDHDAIIFEPGSLSSMEDNEFEPSQRLIIDPGHPICTQKEFLENGYDALRPAGTYWEELKGNKIYTKKWTDIFVQKEPSVRYDLILEDSYNTYIANGIVVRSRGYKDHRYKQFV